MFFVVVLAKENLSPLYIIESLNKISGMLYQLFGMLIFPNSPAFEVQVCDILSPLEIIKDFCGTLNAKSIRANLFLVYELLEENLDYGVFQTLSTSDLRPLGRCLYP